MACSSSRSHQHNRQDRKSVAENTLEVIKNGAYTNLNGKEIDISRSIGTAVAGTEVYTPEMLSDILGQFESAKGANQSTTQFEVTGESTMSCAYRLIITEGLKDVCVLNFASGKNPGGGFLKGSQAQEETVTRSCALYECLIQRGSTYYEANKAARAPFYTHSMIWSPDVPVFRNDVTDQYLDSPFNVHIITAPAVNAGWAHKSGKGTDAEIKIRQCERIRRLLALAVHKGVKVMVLGAWGCGVFGHTARDMAAYFRSELFGDGSFENAFERIVFAVHYVENTENVDAFRKAFP